MSLDKRPTTFADIVHSNRKEKDAGCRGPAKIAKRMPHKGIDRRGGTNHEKE